MDDQNHTLFQRYLNPIPINNHSNYYSIIIQIYRNTQTKVVFFFSLVPLKPSSSNTTV